MDKESRLKAQRYLIVEFVIYGALVMVYAATVLAFLAGPLKDLYFGNLTAWAAEPVHRFFVRNVTEQVLLNTRRPVLVVRPIEIELRNG